ncbi:MAG: hypothetical protein K2X93_25385 [Candidatus Obscuribacterales bacterium]|nr:hypothetical protein [Candidatus Obscuribacterales bacterium]
MFEQTSNWMETEESSYDFDSKPQERRRSRTISRKRHDKASTNAFGDTVFKDQSGRITSFRYNAHGTYYSFEYDKDGKVTSINRSDGWLWRRVNTSNFKGWVVRNYFESWKVEDEDCGSVVIDETGVRATGNNADMIGLPERA